MPIDIRRLRGVASALLALVACLAGYGLVLRATLGRSTWIVQRDQTFNISTSPEKSFGRLLGLKRDVSGNRLGILIGSSTLHQGVDPSILDAEAGRDIRWTNLRVSGTAHEIDLATRTIYSVGLRPEALVIVANPGYLVATSDLRAERGWLDPSAFASWVAAGRWEMARSELAALTMVPGNLAFPYRGRVFTLVDREILAAKIRMFAAIGQGAEALAAPEADPWLNPPPALEATATKETNETILKFIGIKGWFEPTNYRPDGPNFASFADIFRVAREHGTKTFLVFVPESSAYRAKLPDAKVTATPFTRDLANALGEAAPVILDFRESAPDEDFADVNHLNLTGRVRFSHLLAGALKASLGPELPGKP